jgi:hypothetical protein
MPLTRQARNINDADKVDTSTQKTEDQAITDTQLHSVTMGQE